MKRGKDKVKLIEELKKYIPDLLGDVKSLDDLSIHLYEKHSIDEGTLMYVLNDFKRLEECDLIFLGLLSEQISHKIAKSYDVLNIEEWFNEAEIKSMRKYLYIDESSQDEITLPYVFEDVTDLEDGVYCVPIKNSVIARMYKHNLLKYNFDIQREAQMTIRGGETIRTMKVNKKNIKEMTNLILNKKLKKTALAFNCAPDTTKDDSGFEIIYDEDSRTLTVTEGTEIDILDGTHRTLSFYSAYKKDPNITGKTVVHFSNYTTAQARDYQVQLSKQTPIPKARITQLEEDSLSIEVVNRLNSEGILKNGIGVNGNAPSNTYYVLFNDIVKGFEVLWNTEKRSEVRKIVKEFNDYLIYLIEYYDEMEDKKDSLLLDKKLFIGHLALAKKMYESEIPYESLEDILNKHTWNNENETLNNLKTKLIESKFNKRTISDVGKYFENLI